MLDDIALFIRIAQNRSLSAAAVQARLPAATVTRRLRRLEEKIGVQLVHRSARKFALTSEGQAYFDAFADLVDQAELTLRGLSADMHEMRGQLKAAAPTNISVGILEPMWSDFLTTYPDIQLVLTLSNDNKDLLEHQIDLALRAGPQTDLRLYQKKLGSVATILVAAPEYLAKTVEPETPEDLKQHKIIRIAALAHWQLAHLDSGHEASFHPTAHVMVDDISFARQLAADGHGITLLPVTEISEDLEKGRLRPVLSRWQGQKRDIFAVWPSGRLLSARARCLRDFMESYLSSHPVFQGGLPGQPSECGPDQAE